MNILDFHKKKEKPVKQFKKVSHDHQDHRLAHHRHNELWQVNIL